MTNLDDIFIQSQTKQEMLQIFKKKPSDPVKMKYGCSSRQLIIRQNIQNF